MNILVFFLILGEMLSALCHWVWEWLCVSHIWPLLCWVTFPLCPLSAEDFYHKLVLNFVRSFFCTYWNDHMVFILQFVNAVYHTDWFVDIENTLHPWGKFHLIMVYGAFNVLLDQFASILLRIFESMFISDVGLQFSLLF